MASEPTPHKSIDVRIREMEMRIERTQDNYKALKDENNEFFLALQSINTEVQKISHTMFHLKGLPAKIDNLERENIRRSAYNSIAKTIIGIVIGLLTAHFIQNIVLATKEEREYSNVEKSK